MWDSDQQDSQQFLYQIPDLELRPLDVLPGEGPTSPGVPHSLDSSQLTEVGRADGGKSLNKLSFAVIPLFPSHSSHLMSGESMMIVLESTVAGVS